MKPRACGATRVSRSAAAIGPRSLKLALLLGATLLTPKLHANGDPPPDPDPNQWTVPAPPAPLQPLVPPQNPILPTFGASAYLEGSGSVAPTGEYRYTIPIRVPPGVAGLQPDLALTYSSRSGDGILGVGWSLSGLSEIHRCAKTFAIDDRAAGVDYNDSDALCIDGNRLLLTRTEGNIVRRAS